MPTPKKKSAPSSQTLLANNRVFIFDTAAGRVIGKVQGGNLQFIRITGAAVLNFSNSPEGGLTAEFQNIAYAPDEYALAWGGIRGFVPAEGRFLEGYNTFLEERTRGSALITQTPVTDGKTEPV